jgi:hypothetical protein
MLMAIRTGACDLEFLGQRRDGQSARLRAPHVRQAAGAGPGWPGRGALPSGCDSYAGKRRNRHFLFAMLHLNLQART